MVRELFVMAREHAPSIIFMDEVDSIGSARTDNSGGGGDSEVQRTMLELLNQLDGFEATNKIKARVGEGTGGAGGGKGRRVGGPCCCSCCPVLIAPAAPPSRPPPPQVLMATNRIDILDPALLRPGKGGERPPPRRLSCSHARRGGMGRPYLRLQRLSAELPPMDPHPLTHPGRIDRKIEFPNPNEGSRLEILRIHSRKMNLMRVGRLAARAQRPPLLYRHPPSRRCCTLPLLHCAMVPPAIQLWRDEAPADLSVHCGLLPIPALF